MCCRTVRGSSQRLQRYCTSLTKKTPLPLHALQYLLNVMQQPNSTLPTQSHICRIHTVKTRNSPHFAQNTGQISENAIHPMNDYNNHSLSLASIAMRRFRRSVTWSILSSTPSPHFLTSIRLLMPLTLVMGSMPWRRISV